MSGLLALAWLVAIPMAAHAQGLQPYKPGAIKAALAQGKAVLLDYKAVW